MERPTRYKDRDLFLLALEVLARYTEGKPSAAEKLQRLASTLPVNRRTMPVDEMACAVILSQLGVPEAAPLQQLN